MLTRLKARLLMKSDGFFAGNLLGALWNRRNVALNDAALAALSVHAGDRVLEVGFGGGYLLDRMIAAAEGATASGVDASKSLVNRASRRLRKHIRSGRLTVRRERAECLPFADGSFDKAVSVNSLFYWADAARGFAELRRVLVGGGLLVLCLTAKDDLLPKGLHEHGLKLYEKEEVGSLLVSSGFTKIRFEPLSDRHRRFLRVTACAR